MRSAGDERLDVRACLPARQPDDCSESPGPGSFTAMAGEEVFAAHRAKTCDMDVLPPKAAPAEGVYVRCPQVEVRPDRARSKKGLGIGTDPMEGSLNHVLAHLIAVRLDAGTDAGHKVLSAAAKPHHPIDEMGHHARDRGPPRGVCKSHGPCPSIGHQDERAIPALAHQAQTRLGRAESIRPTLQSAAGTHEDLAAVNLSQEGSPAQIQHLGDLCANPIRVVTDCVHIRSLPGGHQMGDADLIQRGKPPDEPAVAKRLQPETAIGP